MSETKALMPIWYGVSRVMVRSSTTSKKLKERLKNEARLNKNSKKRIKNSKKDLDVEQELKDAARNNERLDKIQQDSIKNSRNNKDTTDKDWVDLYRTR